MRSGQSFQSMVRALMLLSIVGNACSRKCFAPNGNAALKSAVNDYIKNGGAKSTAGKRYGATIGSWCVEKVNSFAQVFMNQATFNEPLTNWKTANATSFAQFFQGAAKFNQNLANFDTRKVTNFDRAFYGAKAFQGLGLATWNTARVSSFYWTFKNSSMNANISSWNMGSATDLREVLSGTAFNNNLCLWGNTLKKSMLPSARLANMFANSGCPITTSPSFNDTPTGPLCYACPAWKWGKSCFTEDWNELSDAVSTYVTTVRSLTTNAEKLAHPLSVKYGYPIATWCTNNVKHFDGIFAWYNDFNEPLTYWNTSRAETMAWTFYEARAFNQNLSHFDMSKVTDTNNMFTYATSFEGSGLENWDVSQNQYFYEMFKNAWAFNRDISRWNVQMGLDFHSMFESATSFAQDLSPWKPVLSVEMSAMFKHTSSFNASLCSWGDYLVPLTGAAEMFTDTLCPLVVEPSFDWSPAGPFCTDCPGRNSSVDNLVEGPIALPLVPAAVTQRADNVIVAWSGDDLLAFDDQDGNPNDGTYTCTFDPATNATSVLRVEETHHRMFCPGTATLADGRVLITGGLTSHAATIYNPFSDNWTATGEMNVPRGYHTQLTLSNGNVFVFGGSWSGYLGGKIGEVYDPATESWTLKPGINATGSVVTNDAVGIYRADNHMWHYEATNGKILHVGPAKMMHWLDLTGDGSVTEAGARGDDLDAMCGGCAMFDIDKVFVAGGAENYDVYRTPGSDRAYVIDMSTDVPTVVRQPNMRWRRVMNNLVVLPNGHILVVGGQMAVALFSDESAVTYMELYDPFNQTWSDLKVPLAVGRTYHSVGLLLKDGRVLVGGGGLCGYGCDFEPWNHPNVEIVTPPYLLSPSGQPVASRPSIVSGPDAFVLGGQINVTMDTVTPCTFAIMRLGSSTHTVNLDQRRVPLKVVSHVGARFELELQSNHPAHVPPGLYWLFAIDDAGVPSSGWTLRRETA